MADKILLTKQGRDDLTEKLRYLEEVVKPSVIKDLQEARAQGDLSENADYAAARDHQAEVEAEINRIKHILNNYTLIEKGKSKKVHIGSTVTYFDLSDEEEYTFTIVGSVEADPTNGKISNESALGVALLGKEVSEKEVEVLSEVPYKVIIKSVN